MFLLLLGGAQNAAAVSDPNNRVIFDEEFSWITREGADRLLERIDAAGFNVLVAVVWHGRGTSWPSDLAPMEPKWRKVWHPDHADPLRYLIAQAHKRDIEVHAWFTIALRQRDFFPEFSDPSLPDKAFDLHRPAFRAFIAGVVMEVVRNYDIDGVNLDYIRTIGICRSDRCAEAYRRRSGRDLAADAGAPEVTWAPNPSLVKWQAAATGATVRLIAGQVRAAKPRLVLSIDSVAGIWAEQGADGLSWLDEGLIDVFFHMDYGQTINQELLQTAFGRLADRRGFAILVGNFEQDPDDRHKAWVRDAGLVVELVQAARDLTPDSGTAALYWYSFLDDAQIAGLQDGPFRTPASPRWSLRP